MDLCCSCIRHTSRIQLNCWSCSAQLVRISCRLSVVTVSAVLWRPTTAVNCFISNSISLCNWYDGCFFSIDGGLAYWAVRRVLQSLVGGDTASCLMFFYCRICFSYYFILKVLNRIRWWTRLIVWWCWRWWWWWWWWRFSMYCEAMC